MMATFDLEALVVARGNFDLAFSFSDFGATLIVGQQRTQRFKAENDDEDLSSSDFSNFEIFVDEGGIVRDGVAEVSFYTFENVASSELKTVVVVERENTSGLLIFEIEPANQALTSYKLANTPLPIVEYRITDRLEIDVPVSLVVSTDENTAPVAGDDTAETDEDTSVYIPILDNDGDADGDELSVDLGGPSNGSVDFDGEGYIYTPDADFNGEDSFSYTVSDGNGGTDTATVNITVNAVNDAPVVVGEEETVAEEGRLDLQVLSLLSNDSDPDGDLLEIISVSAGNGTASLGRPFGGVGPDRDFLTYIPNENFNGPDTITYVVGDGNGGETTGTILVDVAPVNDQPVAVDDDSFTTNEDEPLSIPIADLLANDTDVDGDTLTVEPFGQGFSVHGDNLVFTPALNFNGTAFASYIVRDGNGGASVASVEIEVLPVNDAPRALNTAFVFAQGDEDVPITFDPFPGPNMAQFGTDIDGDALTISDLVASSGLAELNPDGTIIHTPEDGFSGFVTITFSVSDGEFTDKSGNIRLQYFSANDDPDAVDDAGLSTGFQTALQIGAATLLGNDTDVDGDTLSIASVGAAVGGTAVLENGVITFTPSDGFDGAASFDYTVSDGNGGTDTATVNVSVNAPQNTAPVAGDDTAETDEDTSVYIPILDNDGDADGDELSVELGGPSNGSVEFDGEGYIYTPDADFNGEDSFGYTISDGNGGSDTGVVSITVAAVNDAPEAEDDGGFSTPFGTALEIDPAALLGNDTDVDEGDTLSVASVGAAVGGTVTLLGGVIMFTPADGFDGAASFEYTVSDGNGGEDTATVSVSVGANTAPVAGDDTAETDEDTSVYIPILDNDGDADGDELSVELGGPSNGSVEFDGEGYIYTPDTDFNGEDSFGYTISDGNGGSDTGVVSITVNPVNDDPIARDDGTFSAVFETPLILATEDLIANDEDGDPELDQTLSIIDVDGAVLSADGSLITFTPGAGFSGETGFSYTLSDGSSTAQAQVRINVLEDLPESPVAANDTYDATEDITLSVAAAQGVLANDTDANGDALSVSLLDDATQGTVILNPNGSFTYTPVADANGGDFFTYTLSDGDPNTADATASVTINIAAVGDDPVAVDDGPLLAEFQTPLVIPVADLLSNDDDGDPELEQSLTIEDVTGATLSSDGLSIVFTPADGFNGQTSFSYTMSDGDATDTAEVTVIVGEQPPASPIATNDSYTTAEDTTLNIAAAGVLANDSDENGDLLSVSLLSQASSGDVTLNADGSFTYVPDPDANGLDSFTYTLSDGDPNTANDTGTVEIDVTPVNDNPVAGNDGPFTTDFETSLVLSVADLLANDDDGDPELDQPLTITEVSGATLSGDGSTITFTPGVGFNGEAGFSYTLSDGTATDTADVAILVGEAPPPPPIVANADTFTTDEDETLTVPTRGVLANDIGTGLSVSLLSDPTRGTVALSADGAFTYIPDPDANGIDSFTYTLTDGDPQTADDIGTVNIDIKPVIDAPVAVQDALEMDEDSFVVLDAALLDNDSDVDGDTLTINAITQGPTSGTIVENLDGTLSYVPNPDFFGDDSFEYSVSDDEGGTDIAPVFVSVRGKPDAPVANDDTAATDSGTETTVNVLGNDTDADGDALTVSLAADAVPDGKGAASVNDDGTISYDPNGDFADLAEGETETVTFEYMISDGELTDTADVSVTVTGTAQPRAIIEGTENIDRLVGTDADEFLLSKAGRFDMMTGGRGADTFVFADELSNGVREIDRILDFSVGEDSILLKSDQYSVVFAGSGALITAGPDQDQIFVFGDVMSISDMGIIVDEFLF